ncbi:hypothetical protein DFH09DRAFT_1110390 [Mycena vulgaris]|nr:hypothetical protein DFH09DRAFT_1110390 [Mycena vulgaris]
MCFSDVFVKRNTDKQRVFHLSPQPAALAFAHSLPSLALSLNMGHTVFGGSKSKGGWVADYMRVIFIGPGTWIERARAARADRVKYSLVIQNTCSLNHGIERLDPLDPTRSKMHVSTALDRSWLSRIHGARWEAWRVGVMVRVRSQRLRARLCFSDIGFVRDKPDLERRRTFGDAPVALGGKKCETKLGTNRMIVKLNRLNMVQLGTSLI